MDRDQFGLKQVIAQMPEDKRKEVLRQAITKLHVRKTKQILPKY
jgi:hypothetical protein